MNLEETDLGAKYNITVADLLEVGAHYGHPVSRWDPRMEPYIFGAKEMVGVTGHKKIKIHVIDIQKTVDMLGRACEFVYDLVSQRNGKILFVGTKRQSQEVIKSVAAGTEMPYVVTRWLGGTLTNFRTIRQGIERYNELSNLIESKEIYTLYQKREANKLVRKVQKMAPYYEGIKDMKKLPDAIFVIDINNEETCVREARKMKVPIIAAVDTNCNPEIVDFPFAGNDDAVRAIKYYVTKVGEVIKKAKEDYQSRLMLPESEPETQQQQIEIPT